MHTTGDLEAKGIFVTRRQPFLYVATTESRETSPRERRKNAPSLQEAYANARLFAAAPMLLDAARAALHDLETLTSEEFSQGAGKRSRDMLRAAIAKAEGRD